MSPLVRAIALRAALALLAITGIPPEVRGEAEFERVSSSNEESMSLEPMQLTSTDKEAVNGGERKQGIVPDDILLKDPTDYEYELVYDTEETDFRLLSDYDKNLTCDYYKCHCLKRPCKYGYPNFYNIRQDSDESDKESKLNGDEVVVTSPKGRRIVTTLSYLKKRAEETERNRGRPDEMIYSKAQRRFLLGLDGEGSGVMGKRFAVPHKRIKADVPGRWEWPGPERFKSGDSADSTEELVRYKRYIQQPNRLKNRNERRVFDAVGYMEKHGGQYKLFKTKSERRRQRNPITTLAERS
mmetsp:Transcript_9429/g.23219  ORF Transcript_9429/g.23219 Transcript_9429/m.23219 type:complete len:298 (+) Transcript_9429:79-972(+)